MDKQPLKIYNMERCKCPKQIAWVERKRQFDSSIWQEVEFLRSVHFFTCYSKKGFTQIYRALYGEGHQHDGWKPLDRNICLQCRIQGRGPGDLGLPLFLNQAEKIFFGRPAPLLIWGSGWPLTPPPPPRSQGLDPALVYYRVLARKREFIPRGTQKHKSNAFPFTRTVQTVQIANSPSPKNIYVTFFTLGRHVNALSHERFIEILAKNPFEVKIFLKYKFLAALKHRFMKVKT